MLAANSNAAVGCDFTKEYLDDLVEHTRSALDEYSSCLSSVSNYARWIEISECKKQAKVENCEELADESLGLRLNQKNGVMEGSDHCNIFRPDKTKLEASIEKKGVQKCKT